MTAFDHFLEHQASQRGLAATDLADAIAREKGPAPRTPGPHRVNFYALDGSVDLTLPMGDGPATLTGGVGGWAEEMRRGLPPVMWWDAPPAYRQEVPLLLVGHSQEEAIHELYKLGRSPGGRRPPPIVMISGPAIHRADLEWVVEGIEAGTKVKRRAGDGNRVEQDFTVKLAHYSGVEVIVERSPSRQAAGKGGGKTKGGRGRTTYRVVRGDSLPEIAARKDIYGDARQWKRIANANGIRDPRSLRVGRVLKIPRD